MSRFLFITLAWLAIPFYCLAAQQDCETIRVSGHGNLPPFSWYQNDAMYGAGVSALQKILSQQDIKLVTVNPVSTQRLEKELRKGHIEITLTATKDAQSANTVDILQPELYSANILVVVRKDSDLIPQAWEDLKHLRGVVASNLSLGDKFENYASKHLSLDRVQRSTQGLLMLEAKRVEYAIYPQIEADLLASLYNYESKLRKAPIEVARRGFYLGVSKNTSCKIPVDVISSALAEMKSSGEIENMINDSLFQWMGLNL